MSQGARLRLSVWKRLAFAIAALLVAICVMEGAFSLGWFAYQGVAGGKEQIAERLHTQYDEELGWINIPGRKFEELYGPGRTLTTNAQGFRGADDVADEVPPGRVRMICSGDSFTLGYGVDDRETWCAELVQLEPRLETVNLGQGGYGIDQAFLWYRRVGFPLPHQVHLFSFIDDDFIRMQSPQFAGYGKPVVEVREGELVVTNQPVPKRSGVTAWLAHRGPWLRELRTVRVLESVARPERKRRGDEPKALEQVPELAWSIFDELQRMANERGVLLVLAYLPRETDYVQDVGLRADLARGTQERGIALVDLTDDLRKLSETEAAQMYLGEGELSFPGAVGHYSREGNRWAAAQLLGHLREIPGFEERLAKAGEQ
jgi:hypothetical protein